MASGIEQAVGVQYGRTQPYAEHFMTNFFLPIMSDARNNSSVLWNMLKKVSKETVSGRFIVWPIRTTRNTGRGAIRPGGQLSDPGSQGGATASMETRTYQGRIKIEGEIFRRGKTNGGAFIEAQALEIEGQMDDLMVDHNRMSHNDGSGRLAEVANTLFAGVTNLDLRINQSIEGAATTTTRPVIYLEVGDRIGFYIPSTDSMRALSGQQGFYVVSIVDADTITIALTAGGAAITDLSTIALATGDWIVRFNTEAVATAPAKSGGARNEMMGLGGIFSDAGVLDGNGIFAAASTDFIQQSGRNDYTGTSTATAGFQGNAATATNPWNRAVVLDNGAGGARTLTEDLLQQAFSDAEELNNANIQMLLSSYATYNSYVRLLTPDKRFNDTLELKGGHKTLSFNGVAWFKDRFCYGNRVYMPNLDALTYFETEPMQPLTAMGLPAWERLKDTDAYWMGHISSGNLGTTDVRQRVGAILVDLAQ